MKSGLQIGAAYTYSLVTTPEMRAHFGEVTIHNLYATAAMLNHMEWAARQLLLPWLEPGEEGVGYHMVIDHMAPAPIGATVTITARVTDIQPQRLTCHCEAFCGERKLGRAKVVQAIVTQLLLKPFTDRI